MTMRQQVLFTLCLTIGLGIVQSAAKQNATHPAAQTTSNADCIKLAQLSSKCLTNTGICLVPAQPVGSPCQCVDGSFGNVVP